MKKVLFLNLFIVSVITFYSCSENKGIWDDNIHLSTKAVEFSASGDSVIIKTGGTSWWISNVAVDSTYYYNFTGVNVLTDNYSIKQDCFVVERRDKNTLFIKVDANPLNVKRIIGVGLQAGDYFDGVTITQKSK